MRFYGCAGSRVAGSRVAVCFVAHVSAHHRRDAPQERLGVRRRWVTQMGRKVCRAHHDKAVDHLVQTQLKHTRRHQVRTGPVGAVKDLYLAVVKHARRLWRHNVNQSPCAVLVQ